MEARVTALREATREHDRHALIVCVVIALGLLIHTFATRDFQPSMISRTLS